MQKPFLFVLFVFISVAAMSQATFQKSFNGVTGYGIALLPDSGFVVIGETYETTTFAPQLLLLRFNAIGDTIWTKKFESVSTAYTFSGFSIKPTNDNGLIICGVVDDTISTFSNALLLKTDSGGNLLWSRAYKDTMINFAGDAVTCVSVTDDNAFVIGYSGYASGMTVIKTDSAGNIQWSNYFAEMDHLKGGEFVRQTPAGEYIITGDHTAAGAGPPYANMELLKLYSNGNLAWIKTWGTTNFEYGTSVLVTNDSCFLTCGTYFNNGNLGCLLTKTDSAGNTLWSNIYGVGNGDIMVYSMDKTDDGGYILCGDNQLGTSYSDIFILKIQGNGTVSWSKSIGSAGNDYGKAVLQALDGGFILTGSDEYLGLSVIKTNNSGISGCNEFGISVNGNSILLQMSPDAFTTHSALISVIPNITAVTNVIADSVLCSNTTTTVTDPGNSLNKIQIYPNPLTEFSTLSIELEKEEKISIEIFDVTGRSYFHTSEHMTGNQTIYFPKNLPPGMLIVKINISGVEYCRKVIVY
jgi:hypothetical protein